jgi:hypothetical protein
MSAGRMETDPAAARPQRADPRTAEQPRAPDVADAQDPRPEAGAIMGVAAAPWAPTLRPPVGYPVRGSA